MEVPSARLRQAWADAMQDAMLCILGDVFRRMKHYDSARFMAAFQHKSITWCQRMRLTSRVVSIYTASAEYQACVKRERLRLMR